MKRLDQHLSRTSFKLPVHYQLLETAYWKIADFYYEIILGEFSKDLDVIIVVIGGSFHRILFEMITHHEI